MPSSFTPLLKLELPATGELSGTWGTTVNNAITTPLSEAVAGTTTITVGGSDYTLSNGDGSAANEARKMFIVATGTPGASRNVICPTASKFYVFRNDTNQTLTLKTLSGTGIAVPAGQYRFLYCDGTNVVETFNAMASLTLGTALAAASGGTGQSSYTTGDLLYATGSTALSKLGIGAANRVLTSSGTAPQWVTSLTGLTGVSSSSVTNTSLTPTRLVYSTTGGAQTDSANLTFDGTSLTLGGNPTLSAGTANGVLYLNGSKVATSGSALTFSGGSLTTTGSFAVSDGTNVGEIKINAATLDFNTSSGGVPQVFRLGSSEQMRLTSTGLGIGTSSPAVKLDVSGSSAVARVLGTAGTVPQLQLSSSGVVAWSLRSNNDGGSDFTIYQDSTQRLKIDSSGNLGIGTSSPSNRLQVVAASGGYWGGSTWTGTPAAVVITNSTVGGYDPVVIGQMTDSGGTSKNSFAIGTVGTGLWTAGNNATQIADLYIAVRDGTGGITERARITSDGNLGIGTSAPGAKLHVATAGNNYIVSHNTAGSTSALLLGAESGQNTIYSWTTVAGSTGRPLAFYTGPSEAMRLDTSGNLGLGVTPSAWKSDWNALDIKTGGAALAAAVAFGAMSTNAFLNASANWVYKASFPALLYQQSSSGVHSWHTAPSGTAGNAISFTQAMTLSATGGLSLGDTNDPGTGVGSFNGVRIGGNGSDINSTYNGASSVLTFRINGTERARIDSSGNLGLGVTPSAWNSLDRGIELSLNTGQGFFAGLYPSIIANAYRNAAENWIYRSSAPASRYTQVLGVHSWHTAPSGTAGNAISFTQAMTLDASGNLGINCSPSFRIDMVGGSATCFMRAQNSTASHQAIYGVDSGGGVEGAVAGSLTNHSFILRTNNTERARITSGGEFQLRSGTTDNQLQFFDTGGVAEVARVGTSSSNLNFLVGSTTTFSLRLTNTRSVVTAAAALATNATDGFLYVPTCAGTPTGTPTAQTGAAPIVVDTTNNKLYFYSGGQWRDAGP